MYMDTIMVDLAASVRGLAASVERMERVQGRGVRALSTRALILGTC